MKLRNELEPKIDIAEKLYPQIVDLISEYDESCENEDSDEMGKIIKKLCSLTGKEITEDDLFEYWEEMDSEELALKLSLPQPDKIGNITKDEVLEIVRRVKDFDEDGISDFFAKEKIPLAGVLNDCYYIPLLMEKTDKLTP